MQGKTEKNAYFPIFEMKFFLRAEQKKSRAELKIVQLCSDSSLIDSIYLLALQRSFIILVGLTMTCFSEKMMIFYSCIRCFVPNLHKKS